jgi:hypothetical protein
MLSDRNPGSTRCSSTNDRVISAAPTDEHDAQRDLQHDQRRARAVVNAARRSTTVLLERFGDRRAEHFGHRREREQHAPETRNRRREGEHRRIDPRRAEPLEARRPQRQQELQPPVAGQHARKPPSAASSSPSTRH